MVYVTKTLGYLVQAGVLYVTHYITYFSITIIYPWFEDIGFYEGAFLRLYIPFLYTLEITSYLNCCIAHPGRPPTYVTTGLSFCEICQVPKPPRTFHCKRCKTCVLKRDHH